MRCLGHPSPCKPGLVMSSRQNKEGVTERDAILVHSEALQNSYTILEFLHITTLRTLEMTIRE